jgi:hypothetical protein
MRIGCRPTFLCKARKYEALNAGRTSSGSSALCKMLMKEWARDKLGYVISLSGPYRWDGVNAKAQKSPGESANGPDAISVLIRQTAVINLSSSGKRF